MENTSLKRNGKVKAKTIQVLNIVLLHNQKPESYVNLFKKLLQEDYVIDLKLIARLKEDIGAEN